MNLLGHSEFFLPITLILFAQLMGCKLVKFFKAYVGLDRSVPLNLISGHKKEVVSLLQLLHFGLNTNLLNSNSKPGNFYKANIIPPHVRT